MNPSRFPSASFTAHAPSPIAINRAGLRPAQQAQLDKVTGLRRQINCTLNMRDTEPIRSRLSEYEVKIVDLSQAPFLLRYIRSYLVERSLKAIGHEINDKFSPKSGSDEMLASLEIEERVGLLLGERPDKVLENPALAAKLEFGLMESKKSREVFEASIWSVLRDESKKSLIDADRVQREIETAINSMCPKIDLQSFKSMANPLVDRAEFLLQSKSIEEFHKTEIKFSLKELNDILREDNSPFDEPVLEGRLNNLSIAVRNAEQTSMRHSHL